MFNYHFYVQRRFGWGLLLIFLNRRVVSQLIHRTFTLSIQHYSQIFDLFFGIFGIMLILTSLLIFPKPDEQLTHLR